jgi:hypothetical protein
VTIAGIMEVGISVVDEDGPIKGLEVPVIEDGVEVDGAGLGNVVGLESSSSKVGTDDGKALGLSDIVIGLVVIDIGEDVGISFTGGVGERDGR